MKQIYKNLYVGSQEDYEGLVKHEEEDWYVIHACKEPYHRNALGYTGRAAPKDHPEYLIARRDNRLILNLVDAPKPEFIPEEIITEALKAIHANIDDRKVLVHCNQGMSRSATIGLLYMHAVHAIDEDFHKAEAEYKKNYPWYVPGNGMRMFAKNNWQNY